MILYYVHDPMCSWCWAYRPTLEKLRRQLPGTVKWQNLLGGLAPDSDEPMTGATRRMILNHWRKIQHQLGTEFNFDFWDICKPRRSTYIACRAVLAAAVQDKEEEMIFAIQRAYYLLAMNPSEKATLAVLSGELELNMQEFLADLVSGSTERELQAQISQARAWPVSGFPSFVLQTGDRVHALPLDYRNEDVTLDAIDSIRA